MQNWLQSLLRPFHSVWRAAKTGSRAKSTRSRWQPRLECLEDRTVPSTLSVLSSNFNGTAIPAGDSIWFNAAFKASGLGSSPVSVHVTNQTISFSAGGTSYNVSVPDSIVNFSAANTVASTSFDAGQNAWVTNLPMNWSGNAFLGGATFVAASGLPGGINPVVWSGNFATDTAGVKLNWQWGAAVYTSFSGDYNALNVKPLDSNSATVYHNSDHAGTPEAYRTFVIGGARGGGGSNWTGSYSGTASVTPTVGSFVESASLAGQVTDINGAPLANVTLTLKDHDGHTFTTTTNMNGFYEFDTVPPGTYSLSDTGSSRDTPYSATPGTGADNNDVTSNGVNEIDNIVLGAGDTALGFNFVEIPVMS